MRSLSNIVIHAKERRILRMRDVERITGYKKSHIYKLMGKGEFPQRVKIGVRTVGWDLYEVEQWVDERLRGGRKMA